jgi:cell division septal protein FtsQ
MAQRRDARRGLRRWLPAAVAALALLALATGVRWVRTSPVFRVERVETGRYRFTRPASLDSLLTTRLGANLWSVDVAAFAQELESLPWVRTATCSRRAPGTLQVRLLEWSPLLLAGDAALVEDGRRLPLPAHVPPPAVPGLVVPDGAAPDVGVLLDLLASVRATGLETSRPLDYVVWGDAGWSLMLEDGTRLLVGDEAFTVRLQRFLDVAAEVPGGAAVDLRFQRQVSYEATSAAGG